MASAPSPAKRARTTSTAPDLYGAGLPEKCLNLVNGVEVDSESGAALPVFNPANGEQITSVTLSTAKDIAQAVKAANAAFPAWSRSTIRSRVQILYKFRELCHQHKDALVKLIVLENGKNVAEALGDVAKGLETVEWACSMPQLISGDILKVSRGVTCHDVSEPLGVVSCIVPFNFPFMVPMWTVPIALAAGNCVILKPSEKVPLTSQYTQKLMVEAGIPPGVFQVIHGDVGAVQGLCDHPDITALSFVGSSRVAEIVSKRCRMLNKRALALGGAKNHLIALEDCDVEMAARDIVASFAGCTGQRCMAASVLVLVGSGATPCQKLLDAVVKRAKAVTAGQEKGQVGPVIDTASQKRIRGYVDRAAAGGAEVLLDGRAWCETMKKGSWFGPTILVFGGKADAQKPAVKDEIFGPVLSVLRVPTWADALAVENGNAHGNAASIYTSIGAHAEYFTSRFRAGMIGVNIGVPVPREPFSFGGMYSSKSMYGDFDITGEGAMKFFTRKRKITSKWTYIAAPKDVANFDAQM